MHIAEYQYELPNWLFCLCCWWWWWCVCGGGGGGGVCVYVCVRVCVCVCVCVCALSSCVCFYPKSLNHQPSSSWPSRRYQAWAPSPGVCLKLDQSLVVHSHNLWASSAPEHLADRTVCWWAKKHESSCETYHMATFQSNLNFHFSPKHLFTVYLPLPRCLLGI